MSINPYDAAFSRIWSQDNIWAGLSSFAVEVGELRDILNLATNKSLVLGDEVCSGTESESATSLVAATLEHLEQKGTNFMFATHLHDLLKVPGFQRPKISVWHLRVIRTPDNKLIYDRTLQPGRGSSSYGLDVAKAMGLPYELMTRAYEIRRSLAGSVSADKAPKSSWNTLIQRAECENCHSKFTPGLEVHHIEERAKGGNNHIRNLAVLCASCHDKHHSGELHIHPLTQTSEGLERAESPGSQEGSPILGSEGKSYGLEQFSYKGKQTAAKKELWTVEQMETIRATMNEFKGRPNTRIASELQLQHGIIITPAQLSRLKH
jgi:DNA mismatch repair protein MutS